MIERGDGARLALEAVVKVARRYLYGDRPAQTRIGSPVDFAHAAFADRTYDFIGAELVSWSESHKVKQVYRIANCVRLSPGFLLGESLPFTRFSPKSPLSFPRLDPPNFRLQSL